jgi:integrase
MRRRDLIRDKARAVSGFFEFANVAPYEVAPAHLKDWQVELEKDVTPGTVYGMTSRVSSFYNWMLSHGPDEWKLAIKMNPVDLARPKAPKPYQSQSSKSLDDGQIKALLDHVRQKAESGDKVGKRDYALMIHFALTGRRREEVIGLRWSDIRSNGAMVVTYRVKGGNLETRIVRDPTVRAAMLDYLEASGRLESMADDTPIWTRHDRAGKPGEQLTSRAFVNNLKRYARQAGIGKIHLHQLRHSFARMAGDESGSMSAVQEALGHKSIATTKIYLESVGVRRDQFSSRLAERLGIGSKLEGVV